MGHYVVTTSAHQDSWRGDSMDDCFCTRGVADMRFEACSEAGHEIVRLIRWTDGTATEIARYEKETGEIHPRFRSLEPAHPAPSRRSPNMRALLRLLKTAAQPLVPCAR
jgi:hypothetical protein